MSDSFREELRRELLDDEDFRYAYAESSLNSRIAAQVKAIREQRGLTQAETAALCGIKQAGFSRFENVNHPVWKTDTLWKIARAFGVRVHVSLETFGTLLDEKQRLSKEYLERPDINHDPGMLLHIEKRPPQSAASPLAPLPTRATGTGGTVIPITSHCSAAAFTQTATKTSPVASVVVIGGGTAVIPETGKGSTLWKK